MRGTPTPSPPTWPHKLRACCCLGGLRSSSVSSGMPRPRSVRCPVRYPVSATLASWYPVPMADLWPYPRSWISAAAGSPAGSTGASEQSLLMRSGLARLVPSGCLCGLTSLPLTAAVSHCGLGGAAGPGPLVISSSLPLSPFALVSQVVWGFPSPPLPRPSSPVTPSHSGVTPEVSSSQENVPLQGCQCPLATRLPLPLTGDTPRGFPPLRSLHAPPHCPPLLRTRRPGFPPAGNPLPFHRFLPRAASRSRLVRGLGGDNPGVAPSSRCAP